MEGLPWSSSANTLGSDTPADAESTGIFRISEMKPYHATRDTGGNGCCDTSLSKNNLVTFTVEYQSEHQLQTWVVNPKPRDAFFELERSMFRISVVTGNLTGVATNLKLKPSFFKLWVKTKIQGSQVSEEAIPLFSRYLDELLLVPDILSSHTGFRALILEVRPLAGQLICACHGGQHGVHARIGDSLMPKPWCSPQS